MTERGDSHRCLHGVSNLVDFLKGTGGLCSERGLKYLEDMQAGRALLSPVYILRRLHIDVESETHHGTDIFFGKIILISHKSAGQVNIC